MSGKGQMIQPIEVYVQNLEHQLAQAREGLEKIVELNAHGQSCSWFCDKTKKCDCHIFIAQQTLAKIRGEK